MGYGILIRPGYRRFAHLRYQTHPGKYSEKSLEKCIPVLSPVSLPSEPCPVLWVSLGPSLWRVCTWPCGAEPCSSLFYVLIMLLSDHPLNRGSTAFHTWINSIMQIVSSPKEIRLWANKKYANKNRKYGSQLRCPFPELWPVVPSLTWSGPVQKGGINRV